MDRKKEKDGKSTAKPRPVHGDVMTPLLDNCSYIEHTALCVLPRVSPPGAGSHLPTCPGSLCRSLELLLLSVSSLSN